MVFGRKSLSNLDAEEFFIFVHDHIHLDIWSVASAVIVRDYFDDTLDQSQLVGIDVLDLGGDVDINADAQYYSFYRTRMYAILRFVEKHFPDNQPAQIKKYRDDLFRGMAADNPIKAYKEVRSEALRRSQQNILRQHNEPLVWQDPGEGGYYTEFFSQFLPGMGRTLLIWYLTAIHYNQQEWVQTLYKTRLECLNQWLPSDLVPIIHGYLSGVDHQEPLIIPSLKESKKAVAEADAKAVGSSSRMFQPSIPKTNTERKSKFFFCCGGRSRG